MKKNIYATLVVVQFLLLFPFDVSGGVKNYFTAAMREKSLKGKILSRVTVYGKTVSNFSRKSRVPVPSFSFLPPDIHRYEILAEERAFFSVPEKDAVKKLIRVLVSFKKLKGMRYYSTGSSAVKRLILDSAPVSAAPSGKRGRVYRIKDNRFGWQSFRQQIYTKGATVVVFNQSLQPMKRFGSSINRAGESLMVYVFHHDPRRKGFFYYGFHAQRVRSTTFRGLGLPSAASMGNRLRASTVHLAKMLGSDWSRHIRAFP